VKKRAGLVWLIMFTLLLLAGCRKESANKQDSLATISKETTDENKQEEVSKTLHFVDAWGEWHDMVINESVKKHPYNLEKLQNQHGTVCYEDDTYVAKKGIDVSHHQGRIDWEAVKEDGIEFVFVRIAYRGYGKGGNLLVDTMQKEYIKRAHEAGLKVGVYVFSQAINEEEALEEAKLVVDTLEDTKLELPVVFDPELIRDDDARTDTVSGEQFTKNTIVFCEYVKKKGYTPMVYSNMVWEWRLFDMEQIQQYGIWYADYEKIPQTPYDFEFWQYSEKGHVSGVQGNCDLDVWFCKK